MSDQNPISPAAAVTPKAPEAAKVQPKKETVRINLPPKPTASPTIKIPSPAAVAAVAPAAAAPAAVAAPATGPRAAAPASAAPAPAAPPRPTAAAAPRRAASSAGIGTIDKVLAIAAALVGILVAVRVVTLGM